MNFCVHKSHSQCVPNGFRIPSIFANLNQIAPVLFFHKWKSGEKQIGWAQPLSRQYAPFSGTPKPPRPVKQRQDFVECRRLDFFKEAVPGIARLAAAPTSLFSHGSARISFEITSKLYVCSLLGNRLALLPGFAKIGGVGHFPLQVSTIIRG